MLSDIRQHRFAVVLAVLCLALLIASPAHLDLGYGSTAAEVTTGMGIQHDGKVRGVGGDIRWTDPWLVPPGGGINSWVYSYVGSRLNAVGVSWWIKWGHKKNYSNTYKVFLEWRDATGTVWKRSYSDPVPVFLSYRHYDFHYFNTFVRHEFFVDQTYYTSVFYGSGSQQIPWTMADIAFAGTDVSLYRQERLRNPPDPVPPDYVQCYINYRELEWYKPNNADPNVFVWKPWNNMVLDAAAYGVEYYGSTEYAQDEFIAWNYSSILPPNQDPCLL